MLPAQGRNVLAQHGVIRLQINLFQTAALVALRHLRDQRFAMLKQVLPLALWVPAQVPAVLAGVAAAHPSEGAQEIRCALVWDRRQLVRWMRQ